jgi:hypothetical protein
MKKFFLSLYFLSFNLFYSYSQRPENLLIVNFQDKEYFAPDIINFLTNLKVINQKERNKYFDRIIVLNQLQRHIKEQSSIKVLVDFFKQNTNYSDLNKGAKQLYDSLAKNLGNYNSLLDININQINNLTEIQFSLYSNILSKGENTIPTKDPRNPDKYQSIVFIPQENNYLHIIEKGIKTLFPETDQFPQSVIFINKERNVYKKSFYFANDDSITLDGSYSLDIDSKRDDLSYTWREIDTLSKLDNLPIDFSSPKISFKLTNPGKYHIGLKVFDGIHYSIEDTISIIISLRPKLYVEINYVKFVYQDNGGPWRDKILKTVDIASSNTHPILADFFVEDLNKDIYLNDIDTLSVTQRYLEYDSIPSTSRILQNEYEAWHKTVKIDSIKAFSNGYRLFFSGNPIRKTYTYKIYEVYNHLKSNPIKINFSTEYLTSYKIGFEVMNISLSSHKFINWGSSNIKANSDSTKFNYGYNYAYYYLSTYLTRKLLWDINLSSIYNRFIAKRNMDYLPLMKFSYRIGNKLGDNEYLGISPLISLGIINYDKNTNSGPGSFGFGGSIDYCIKNSIYLIYGVEYLTGGGFHGISIDYSLRVDVIKIMNDIFKKDTKAN